jgi:DNA invertase Pin-like site-specific DNA recombinase
MTKTSKTPTRAVLYARQSRTRDGSESREDQIRHGRETCERLGLDVVAELVEAASTSGYKDRGRGRPEFRRLLSMIEDGEVDVVVAYKTDRLSRGGGVGWHDLLVAIETAGLDVNHAVVCAGGYVSEFEIGIRATMDLEESRKLADRSRDRARKAADQGRPNGGGKRRCGYADTSMQAVDKREAKYLREARDRIVSGESVSAVVRDLTRRGFRTPEGSEWTGPNLGRTLRQPYLAALRQHHTELVPASWSPIFTTDEHAEIAAAKGERLPVTTRAHFLTGLVRCGDSSCGGRMRRMSRGVYQCRACHRTTMAADLLEEMISDAVATALDSSSTRRALKGAKRGRDIRTIEAEIEADQQALRELSHDRYVARTITADEFASARAELAERVRIGEAELVALKGRKTVTDPVAVWRTGDLDQRRAVLAEIVELITIAPVGKAAGGRGQSVGWERVTISWRA